MLWSRSLEDWGFIAVIATTALTAIGVIVTVLIFVVQQHGLRQDAAVAARKAAVAEVLDAVDRAARAYALFPISRFWTKGSMELVLTLSRLLLALPKRDRAVAYWVARQVQLMELATTEKRALRLVTTAGLRLASWHQGDVATKWFVDQNERDPFVEEFNVPIAIRMGRSSREVLSWAKLFGGVGVVVFAGRAAAASFEARVS